MSYYIYPTDALQDVQRERNNQEELKYQGKFDSTCADNIDEKYKLVILAEEFGEVAKLICEQTINPNRRMPATLREELIQVAAVAVAWVEALDKEKP